MISGGNDPNKFQNKNAAEDSMIKKKLIDFQIDLNRSQMSNPKFSYLKRSESLAIFKKMSQKKSTQSLGRS
jgi:hypothetical protein